MRRALALCHLTIAEAAPVGVVTAAASAGFRAVGLRITGFSPDGPGPDLVGNAPAIRELRRTLAEEGIGVTSVCAYRVTPAVRAADYAPVFAACAEIGATTLLATCFIADRSQAVDKLSAIGEEAAKAGVRIGLEFFRTSELKTLAAAEELRRRLGRPDAGHIIDALHLWRAGNAPADLAGLDPASIIGLQLCDGPRTPPADGALAGEIRDRLYPGEGELPLFDLLDAVAPELPVEIEVPKPALAGLPARERARRAHRAGQAFLDRYAEARPAVPPPATRARAPDAAP